MFRGVMAVLGLLVLAGCAGDVAPSVETPSMYQSMAREGAKVDVAASNSFGFGGHNVALVFSGFDG